MGDADFQRTVNRWLEDNPGRAAKTYRGAVALYHNKLPRELRPYGVMHWFSKTSVASSAPALAYFYGSIAPATAALAAGGIFCAHSAVGVFDRLSKEKVAGPTDNQPEILVRFGDLLTALRANATAAPNKDAAITACLGILEIFARQTTKTKKGEIAVSLCLYAGQSRTRMKIRHRNPGNERPLNREFDCSTVLGHHACQAGSFQRVVHDIRQFGRAASASPTQSTMNYRSIFIIPVESRRANGNPAKGFISIDCQRPYAFYGNRANVIVVTCEPVISHICDLI